MSNTAADAAYYIKKINELIAILESVEAELPDALKGVNTRRMCRELNKSIEKYKKISQVLYQLL